MLFCVTILFFVAIWKAEGIPVDSNEKEVSVQSVDVWLCGVYISTRRVSNRNNIIQIQIKE